jgi:hypothetical protein
MLKLISRRPSASRREGRNKANEVRRLFREIGEQRVLGDATQRVVAQGRRALVETYCRALGGPAPASARAGTLEDVACRLNDIHQRLLEWSSRVELEMDRLEVVRTEIERLYADVRSRKGQR